MRTVEQIMGLAGTYAYLSETQDANGRAFDEAEVALRTAIEELAADAEKHGELAESAANFMRGMTFDSRLPEDIRFAVLSKIAAIDAAMEST